MSYCKINFTVGLSRSCLYDRNQRNRSSGAYAAVRSAFDVFNVNENRFSFFQNSAVFFHNPFIFKSQISLESEKSAAVFFPVFRRRFSRDLSEAGGEMSAAAESAASGCFGDGDFFSPQQYLRFFDARFHEIFHG